MPYKNPQIILKDIKKNIILARKFLEGLSFEEFINDPKTAYAVIRALEIISEASRRLPEEIIPNPIAITLFCESRGAGSGERDIYYLYAES